MFKDLRIDKLDFDALYDQAEATGCYGECPLCEEEHILCPVCRVCLKNCHDDYSHEVFIDPADYHEEQI